MGGKYKLFIFIYKVTIVLFTFIIESLKSIEYI